MNPETTSKAALIGSKKTAHATARNATKHEERPRTLLAKAGGGCSGLSKRGAREVPWTPGSTSVSEEKPARSARVRYLVGGKQNIKIYKIKLLNLKMGKGTRGVN
jgi:hypothetical protein